MKQTMHFSKKIICTYLEVGDLEQEEVFLVLSELGIIRTQISPKLLDLLKVPLHLKAFADIYDKNLDLKAITTLQNLYDYLWERKILSSPNFGTVIDAIEMVTDLMDASKSLFVSSTARDRNKIGIEHLLNQSLLLQSPNARQLQFFHQTFFDYCYARIFLNRHASLIEIILQQHQSFFVRSQIKQVLGYLRDREPQKYLTELHDFLNHSCIFFHIKLLVIDLLASIESPINEEWRIARHLLDTDPEFTIHFLDAIQNERWLKYLIGHGYFQRFLTAADDQLFRIALWKLESLIDSCTDTVVDFLEDFPRIEWRNEQIGRIMLSLTHWENPKALQLFEQYLPTIKSFSDSHQYYHILENVFPYQPERISQLFFKELDSKIEAIPSTEKFDKKHIFEHGDIDVFEAIQKHEATQELALTEGIVILCRLIEKTRIQSQIEFYHDRAFRFFEKFGATLHQHWMFLALVKGQLLLLAQQDNGRFKELTSHFGNSYSFTLLKLLLQGYSTDPVSYLKESFMLLTRPGILQHMVSEYAGGYEVRSLLRQIYPLLEVRQKEQLNSQILAMTSGKETSRYQEFHQYQLVCTIPVEELQIFPELLDIHHRLEQVFGPYEEQTPETIRITEVGPPLPESSYHTMTNDQWIESFKQYDESTGWDHPRESMLKGGIVEHSRRFTEEVSARPDDFYDFIFSLGERLDIPHGYLEAGLDGLVKGKYDVKKIKAFVKACWRYPDSGFRRSVIWAVDYINKEAALDVELLAILQEYALHDPDPAEESWTIDPGGGTPYDGGDALNSGINTVRGAAASRLAIHGYTTHYPENIFAIMQQVANDPAVSVRCCLIADLQGMLRWDQHQTYQIFMTLTRDLHPQIIQYGLPCLAYLMIPENFQTFIPHLKIAMEIDEQIGHQHVQEYVGQILMLAYVRSYPGSQGLLEAGFQYANHVKAGAIQFASEHLLEPDQEVAEKTQRIFQQFLCEDSKEIGDKYDSAFHSFESTDFHRLYPLIEQYVISKVATHASHWFFDYLLKCLDMEPEKCLDLLISYLQANHPETKQGRWIERDQHIRILVGAYNRLSTDDYREKTMYFFDSMLKDRAYKQAGLKILTEHDRE